MKLLTILNRTVIGYLWLINLLNTLSTDACGPIVLVSLVNNWPWPHHSNIASYSPEMLLDSISESVHLQNFLHDPLDLACFACQHACVLCTKWACILLS